MPMDDGPGEEFSMTMLDLGGDQEHCAFVELPDASSPASWATYFMVEDIHASVDQGSIAWCRVGFRCHGRASRGVRRNGRSTRSSVQLVAGSRASWFERI